MSNPTPDLSRLRINRDHAPPQVARAFRLTLGIVALAALLGVGGFVALRGGGGLQVETSVAEVRGGASGSPTGITANGYVVARTKASVGAKIAGRMEYLGVTEGSVVSKGQVIARLESADYQAAVAQAEADLARARASLVEARTQRDQLERNAVRAKDLLERNLTSRQEAENVESERDAARARVDVQEAQVQAADATIRAARAALENTNIRAPFDGTVLRKDAEVGEVVAPSVAGGGLTRGAVVTMADLKTLEVEVDVNEAYIAQIRNGQPSAITLDAYPDTTFKGRVRQIVPTADRQRATVLVKVSILDHDPRILPEMGAKVEFLSEQRPGPGPATAPRVFVPSAGVRNDGDRQVVWVVREGKLERREVDAGPVTGDRREIRRGLSGGERVVVSDAENLKVGARVK